MRIGIDIDGVLNYIEKFQLSYGIPWFKEHGYEVVNPNGFEISDIFGCSKEVEREFWKSTVDGGIPIKDALIFKLAKEAKMRPGVKELLKELYNNGNDCYIITERYGTGKNTLMSNYYKKLVYNWLKDNDIDIAHDKIIFVPDDKSKKDIYKEKNIEVILEDKIDNLKAIEEIEDLYAICFNAAYNKEYNHEKLYRVDLPTEVFKVVKQIENIKEEKRKAKEIIRPNQFYPTTGKASVDRVYRQYITKEEEELNVPDMKIIDYLREKAKNFPDVVMVKDEFGHSYTYDEFLNNLVPVYAKAFKNLNVEAGEPVVIALPNLIATLAAKYALNDIGAVPVMANPLSNIDEFVNYLSTVVEGKKVKTALTFNRSYDIVKKALENEKVALDHIVNIGVNSDFSFPLSLGYKLTQGKYDPKNSELKKNELVLSLDEFLSGAQNIDSYEKTPYISDAPAVIYFTGGTTGTEKAVITTDKNAIAVAMAFTEYIKGDKVGKLTINAMPFFHVFGDNQIFYFAACNGMTNLLIPKFNKNDVEKIFKKYGEVVNCNGVPAFLQAISDKLEDEERLGSIENMISGGSLLSKEFTNEMNKRLKRSGSKARVGNGYGNTESDGGLSYTLVGSDEAGCIGIPTPGTNLKIVKPGTTIELNYGEEGEICATGPSIMKGYLNNKEETEKALKVHDDGKLWLHTGDLGYAKENGKFYITDRIKRMIIVSGENVYPTRVEQEIIDKHANLVDQCFVISKPDKQKGEVPAAKVLLKPGVEPTEAIKKEILDTCKKKFKNKKYWPTSLDFIKTVPLTKMSKPDYKVLDDPKLIVQTIDNNEEIDELNDKYAGNKFYRNFAKIYSPIYKHAPIYSRNVTYIGKENIPEKSSGIITMNHLHAQDQNAIYASVDRIISSPAKKEYFEKPISKYFMEHMDMIPVDRYGDANYAKEWLKGIVNTAKLSEFEKEEPIINDIYKFIDSIDVKKCNKPQDIVNETLAYINYSRDKRSFITDLKSRISNMPTSGLENNYGRALSVNDEVITRLKNNRLIAVFPEGTRNKEFYETGELYKFHDGAAFWARDSYSPIIPTAITGEHKAGGDILVRSGEQIYVDKDLSDSDIKDVTKDLRDKTLELVSLNLVDQDTANNTKALLKIISNLKNKNDGYSKKLLEIISNELKLNQSERNEKIYRKI